LTTRNESVIVFDPRHFMNHTLPTGKRISTKEGNQSRCKKRYDFETRFNRKFFTFPLQRWRFSSLLIKQFRFQLMRERASVFDMAASSIIGLYRVALGR